MRRATFTGPRDPVPRFDDVPIDEYVLLDPKRETGVRGYCHAIAPNSNVDSFTEGYAPRSDAVNTRRSPLGNHTQSCQNHRTNRT